MLPPLAVSQGLAHQPMIETTKPTRSPKAAQAAMNSVTTGVPVEVAGPQERDEAERSANQAAERDEHAREAEEHRAAGQKNTPGDPEPANDVPLAGVHSAPPMSRRARRQTTLTT